MENLKTKKPTKNCDVCSKIMSVGTYGGGTCPHCGWHQDDVAILHPAEAVEPNMVSYNKAKLLVSQGKKIKPSIEEFAEAGDGYGEMMFYYNKQLYYVMFYSKEISFYEYPNPKQYFQNFKTAEEFMSNASINGRLLKDIWYEVEDADYM